jgi:hypothetical protein
MGDCPSFFSFSKTAAFEKIRQLFLTRRSVLVWIRVQSIKSTSKTRSFIYLAPIKTLIVLQNPSQAGASAWGYFAQVWSLGIETGRHGDGFKKHFIDWMRLCSSYTGRRRETEKPFWNN